MSERARWQARACRDLGSPMYAELSERIADDLLAGGPTVAVFEAADAVTVPLLGMFAGVHRLALTGEAPTIAAHYPSTGGDGDIDAAWHALRELMEQRTDELAAAALVTPQTNEVGRSASLLGGFLTVANETLPRLRVLEIGSSAGLNLRFDRYRYEQGLAGFGPPDAAVRFRDVWHGGVPPFDAGLEVVSRRGCDLSPIDPTTPEGRLTLLSVIWPDQIERFGRLDAAIAMAGEVAAPVDRADLVTWLTQHVASPVSGVATVVFHSLVWMYLPSDVRATTKDLLRAAGDRATHEAPFAWLRLEASREAAEGHGPLVLTTWPGGNERELARCSFHYGPVEWFG